MDKHTHIRAVIFDVDGVLVDVVEDAVNGVQAAKSAGMRCVAATTSFPADRFQETAVVRAAIADMSLLDLAPH
jgi:beta-phosphoglucomutase-like phosphatase (HAD superfamily)